MKPEQQPIILRPGEGRILAGGLLCRISSASTGGAYCVFEVVTPPGEGVPLHVHSREDEVYYILEGRYEIQCGQRTFTAEAGAMAVLPRNVPHAFCNAGKTPSRTLTIFIPGGFDAFVEELNALARRTLRPRTSAPPSGGNTASGWSMRTREDLQTSNPMPPFPRR